ncbi:glycosyltransferase [Streptomyces gibsoniae]|uniref:D-inositol 3-phosphate glycosyltransferase n=1 Tax=Streptomyces gibsoniae TaxID=3075529 RepID=A0ABU2TTC6_9ACTN|nr:glycosyltransferase [Streptomyces sp. DSM 41699]MDT0464112.1 glycosyltransferase [Streptomyces sp. DSM 41699]
MTSSTDALGAFAPEGPGSLAVALVSAPPAPLGEAGTGGWSAQIADLAGALAGRGHRVTLYTRRDDPDLPDRMTLRDGVEVRRVPAGPPEPLSMNELLPHLWELGRHLAGVWRVRPPDVVHSHGWLSGLAALRVARELELPLLHSHHSLGTVTRRQPQPAGPRHPRRIAHEREVGRGCDHIIATCRDEVVELGRMGMSRGRISVVPYGVDTAVFTPHGPAAAPGTAYRRLLQLGSLGPHGDSVVSIAALALLPTAELVVVGGPPADRLDGDPEVRRLRRAAADAGVADRVRFLGGVPGHEVPALLRGADVVLCPADHEPFGIAALEAMACGRPVVATAVGGHLDTVADPGTGRLVPPGDPNALARAAGELLADPEARKACGAAGRRRALRRYGWERVAAATEEAYCAVLDAQCAVPRWSATAAAARRGRAPGGPFGQVRVSSAVAPVSSSSVS